MRSTHSSLEAGAPIFFAAHVLLDGLAHLADSHPKRAKLFESIGLVCFGVAIITEILAYTHSRRNDTLSRQQDKKQTEKTAAMQRETQTLVDSTQQLKTDAQIAHTDAEGFKAKIGDSNARAKHAEAQVASANAASKDALTPLAGRRWTSFWVGDVSTLTLGIFRPELLLKA